MRTKPQRPGCVIYFSRCLGINLNKSYGENNDFLKTIQMMEAG